MRIAPLLPSQAPNPDLPEARETLLVHATVDAPHHAIMGDLDDFEGVLARVRQSVVHQIEQRNQEHLIGVQSDAPQSE